MRGFAVRVGAWVFACALCVGGAALGESPRPGGAAMPLADATNVFAPPPMRMGESRRGADEARRTVPLPPGVYVGLVGLASAAIARQRFLKRH